MQDKVKQWTRAAVVYAIVIALTVVAVSLYQQQETRTYMAAYKDAGGHEVLSDIGDTYKLIMEHYSNYKLNPDTKRRIVRQLEALRGELKEVDHKINGNKPGTRKINFSFVYHDMKLVRLSLSDTTKDDIVPVIVLHASEGLKELEKDITYIEFR